MTEPTKNYTVTVRAPFWASMTVVAPSGPAAIVAARAAFEAGDFDVGEPGTPDWHAANVETAPDAETAPSTGFPPTPHLEHFHETRNQARVARELIEHLHSLGFTLTREDGGECPSAADLASTWLGVDQDAVDREMLDVQRWRRDRVQER